jgi:acetyl esterase/lipase
VIVYSHSGGWIGGDLTNVPDVLLAQVGRGYALASLGYLLATVTADGQPVAAFPGAVWDVKRGIRFLKANAAQWNLDPARVVVAGGSAGGYLAAFAGATAGLFEPPELRPTSNRLRDSSVIAIVDIVGPTNLASFEHTDNAWAAPLASAFLGCATPSETQPFTCSADILDTASVWPYVDRADPPIFMGYGADDGLVVPATQGEPLARAWTVEHHGEPGSVVYDVVPGAGHTLPLDGTMIPISNFLDRTTVARSRSART